MAKDVRTAADALIADREQLREALSHYAGRMSTDDLRDFVLAAMEIAGPELRYVNNDSVPDGCEVLRLKPVAIE